jgi:transcriptional regulator with XRE-family HTH domain/Zn-dependent peptidase ImmA (M78 family)
MNSTPHAPDTDPGIPPGYDRIESAEISDGILSVRFADGANVDAPLEALLGTARPPSKPTVTPAAVLFSGEPPQEISWLAIRSATDPAFSQELLRSADEEARQIGERLRRLRKARGMRAKDVAERAGIAPMSLSRIETGKHDVVYRTLQRVLAAMGCTLRDLAELEPAPTAATREIVRRLTKAGVPGRVLERILLGEQDQPERVLERVGRIFRWTPEQIAGTGALLPAPAVAAAARFKAAVNQNPAHATYLMWANYLALLVDAACERPKTEIPENPVAIRQDIVSAHGGVRFEGLLDWCWDHNIAVLPLDDSGEFHGACWNFGGRAVIVLKQQTPWESRWTFDLAHELGHVARHLEEAGGVVESGEITPLGEPDGDEQEASDFAGEILLGDPDTLARILAQLTEGHLPRLKAQVRLLAEREHVESDALANYMAYRLAAENENWWATAAKLQDESGQAQLLARTRLLERLDLARLAPDDRAILTSALQEPV